MDISAFSDPNFDTKAWINVTLKNLESQEKKENYTMSLVTKLQLYVQQVNKVLEETSQQILTSLPRILHDSKNLENEAALLKEKMAAIKEEVIKIEQDTGKSINALEKLDSTKKKLFMAKQGLHESDNWAILLNDLEEVFDSKNIEAISGKILGMQQSLKLLVNVADYEDRKLQLEGLKNRLEAIASPSIVQAFTTNNTEQALRFEKIFVSIDRLPQLLKYYHNCQKEVLLKKWRDQLEVEQDVSVALLIHNYYDILLSNWHTQLKWFNQVFSKHCSSDILMEVYTDVLTGLDPSLNDCIDAALKELSEKLDFLFEVKQITKQFAYNLLNLIDSSSNQVKINTVINKDKFLPLLQAIYNPFVCYVGKYAAYEQAHLMKQLSTIKCIKEELPDTIQALGLSIPVVMDAAREAQKRCTQITENCGYCGLLMALRAFLLTYADQYKVALRQLNRLKQKEDWYLFQLCLSLLQNTGDVLMNLSQLEKELTSTLLEPQTTDTIIEYKYLLLNPVDRREYESLLKCISEGIELSVLDHVTTDFSKLCTEIHSTTYEVVFSPIPQHLEVVSLENTWLPFADSSAHRADLPDYSYSPQDYITQIGEYLMTLPHHLEPFFLKENPSLTCALRAADPSYNSAADREGALTDVFLDIIARATCQEYCDRILSIKELSHPAARQLSHDICYLGGILGDLGLDLSDNLHHLAQLLKIPIDQYQAQSIGCPAKYVAAVRQMRNITSSS